MHHALEIQEILSNIIAHCHPRDHSKETDLLALATTCRAFKEPALDLLWEGLRGLFPLVQCLPEAFYLLPYKYHWSKRYSFDRPLTPSEWEILRSYTRRIRSITYNFSRGLNKKSLGILLTPPTNQPLFPNLRRLRYESYGTESIELRESLELFSSSPNVASISIVVDQPSIAVNKLVSNCICRWRNLRFSVLCPTISLEFDALAHLARVPTLSELSFKEVVPDCTSPLSFSNLGELTLNPASLATASRLLSHILLPTIEDLMVNIDDCPSKQDLSSFLSNIKTCTGHTIKRLLVVQERYQSMDIGRSPPSLSLADLRPCMEFRNLCMVQVDITWIVGLTDYELLTLASAWPNLEALYINSNWGWNAQGGLTPNGFVQLLQTCPSLRAVSLVMDTRGYTELSPTNPGFTIPHHFSLNVLDSAIEAESVPAIVAFLKKLHISDVCAWLCNRSEQSPGFKVYRNLWKDVQSRIGPVGRHS